MVLVVTAAGAAPVVAPPTNEVPLITMAPTAFGCDITVRAHNKSTSNVTIDLEDSESKIKNGFWKKFNEGGTWVVNTGGEHESTGVSLDRGCDVRRQYKVRKTQGDNIKYIYFPGEDDLTESTPLGLANVGRHF